MATETAPTSESINDLLNTIRNAAVQIKNGRARGEDFSEAEGRLLEAVDALARERDALQGVEQPPPETNAGLTHDQVDWLRRVGRLVEREKKKKPESRGEAYLEEVEKAPQSSKAAKEG